MSSRVGVWGTVVLRTSEFSVLHKGVAALAVFLQAQLRAWGLGVLRLVTRELFFFKAKVISSFLVVSDACEYHKWVEYFAQCEY